MKQLAGFLLCVVLMGCSEEPDSWPKKAFDAAEWARAGEGDRYVFARDLVESRRLLGMPGTEVKKLLGRPTLDSPDEHYFTYFLKSGGSGFDQIFVLDIKTNSSTGVVESASIRGD
jgi:hypothetical protein